MSRVTRTLLALTALATLGGGAHAGGAPEPAPRSEAPRATILRTAAPTIHIAAPRAAAEPAETLVFPAAPGGDVFGDFVIPAWAARATDADDVAWLEAPRGELPTAAVTLFSVRF